MDRKKPPRVRLTPNHLVPGTVLDDRFGRLLFVLGVSELYCSLLYPDGVSCAHLKSAVMEYVSNGWWRICREG